jgi:hypothetical protein
MKQSRKCFDNQDEGEEHKDKGHEDGKDCEEEEYEEEDDEDQNKDKSDSG